MMDHHHIQLCGLSETHLQSSQAKHRLNNDSKYTAFFSSSSNFVKDKNSGVGIILTKHYARYVQSYKGYEGRALHVDMYMRGHTKLRVIQLYSHASQINDNRKKIEELHAYVLKIIKEAQQKRFMIILMGDFNINYANFMELYNRRHNVSNWRYRFLNDLKNLQLFDVMTLCHDITHRNPMNTRISNRVDQNSSRIDYIWISQELTQLCNLKNADTVEQYIIPKLDHLLIFVEFWTKDIFQKKSSARLRQ